MLNINTLVILVVASTFLSHTFAQTIRYPSTIAANSNFTLTVNGIDASSYSFYRVYLATTPQGYSGGPSCYLQNSTSLSDTTLTLSIPADFAPDGNVYSMLARAFSTQGGGGWTNGTSFTFTASSIANFTPYEEALNGAALWSPDDIPCESYNCARDCAQSGYPGDLNESSSDYTALNKCVQKCPGVAAKSSTNTITAALSVATSGYSGEVSSNATTTTVDDIPSPTTATAPGPALPQMSVAKANKDTWQAPLLAAGGVLALLV